MVSGAAYSALDRAPLIMITDRYSTPAHEVGLRQRIDQLAIYGLLMKWSTTIDARTVRQQLRRATRTATAPAPGTVQFDMLQSETTKEADELAAEARSVAQHSEFPVLMRTSYAHFCSQN